MVLSGGVALLMLNVGTRRYGVLATAGHPYLDLIVQLVPWLLLGVAVLLGTAERVEDAVFRRRMVLALALAVASVGVGVVFWAIVPPASETIGLVRSLLFFWVIWLPGYVFAAFRGFGSSVDATVVRWLGPAPPPDADSEMRRRDREIREAAGAEERHRLAQDLHDSIKQEIFAIHTSAATIQARLSTDPEGARLAIEQVRRSSRDAMIEIEAMLDRLSPTPVENDGLINALRKQCEALALRTGAEVECDIRQLPSSKLLPQGAHEALFRIAQEGLSNVGKHARATKVILSLRCAERDLVLSVEDNGQGFDKQNPTAEARLGMGLRNMQERSRAVGGRFKFLAFPGGGVTITAAIPVSHGPYNAGWPRWQTWLVNAIIVAPMLLVLGLVLFSFPERIDWGSIAGFVVYAVFMSFMIRRAVREDPFK